MESMLQSSSVILSLWLSSEIGRTMCSTWCRMSLMSVYSVASFAISNLLNCSANRCGVGIYVDSACYDYMREITTYFVVDEIYTNPFLN